MVPTEQLRREAIIAASVAQSRGFTITNASRDMQMACHAIARSVMAGVNQLVLEEGQRVRAATIREFSEATRKQVEKTYEDAFNDGQAGDYRGPRSLERAS